MPMRSADAYPCLILITKTTMEPVQSSAQTTLLPFLQGNAEEGDQATGNNRSTEFASKTDGSTRAAGAGLSSTRGGGRARAGVGAAGGRGTTACAARARGLRLILGGLVTALLIACLVACELLGGYLVGLVDATTVPEAAHLARHRLLVIGHGGDGAVPALASELEGVLVTFVPSGSNLTLSTANLRAGVFLGLAPLGLQVVRHQVGVDSAAGLNG